VHGLDQHFENIRCDWLSGFGKDPSTTFDQWLKRRGNPRVRMSKSYEGKKYLFVFLNQHYDSD
jgi:hypothetical protein